MILTVLPGTILIVVVGYDVFVTLFNPEQYGSLSQRGLNRIWSLLPQSLSRNDRFSSRLGPIFFVLVLATWMLGMVLGWALVYWPFMDADVFLFASGLDPSAQRSFFDALYFSAVTLTTLGFGDLTPKNDLLRILIPIEAIIGFALLTAGLTWLLSLYPVLANNRSLAQRIHVLLEQSNGRGLLEARFSETSAASTYEVLIQQIIRARTDLLQFPIVFYFRTREPQSDLALMLPRVADLLAAEERSDPPESMQVHLDGLRLALERITEHTDHAFPNIGEGAT